MFFIFDFYRQSKGKEKITNIFDSKRHENADLWQNALSLHPLHTVARFDQQETPALCSCINVVISEKPLLFCENRHGNAA